MKEGGKKEKWNEERKKRRRKDKRDERDTDIQKNQFARIDFVQNKRIKHIGQQINGDEEKYKKIKLAKR